MISYGFKDNILSLYRVNASGPCLCVECSLWEDNSVAKAIGQRKDMIELRKYVIYKRALGLQGVVV